ncbi:Uncharacterised protein [Raoultella ornithinolytica]|nr:Uncharacterised protein [Raoultella ornithinolytica]
MIVFNVFYRVSAIIGTDKQHQHNDFIDKNKIEKHSYTHHYTH